MTITTFSKRTGYPMANRQVGYSGEKFSEKCFQRQLREAKDDGREKMTIEELHSSVVEELSFQEAQRFILDYEWLGTMGTTKFSYGLRNADGELFAVYCFGLTAGTQVLAEPFGEKFKSEGIVLVRGACAPFAHEHSSTYGLGKVLKLVRDRGYSFVIAYSDVEAGEIGTVYQADNWNFYGITNPINYLVRPDGKRVDPKIIHKYAKKFNITSQEQKQKFLDEGYIFEKGTSKLKYLKIIGDKRKKKELMKNIRVKFYPYAKRQSNMEGIIPEIKKMIRASQS